MLHLELLVKLRAVDGCQVKILRYGLTISSHTASQPWKILCCYSLDTRDIHISINILDKIKTNWIILLCFSPPCSHKLQPLDRSVHGPLKCYNNNACNSWQINDPGKAMTTYNIADNLGQAFQKAFAPENISEGFRVIGLWPFNRNVFHDDVFLSANACSMPEPGSDLKESLCWWKAC